MAQQLETLAIPSRGPAFSSQHPRGSAQLSVIPIPGNSIPLLVLKGTVSCDTQTCMHIKVPYSLNQSK